MSWHQDAHVFVCNCHCPTIGDGEADSQVTEDHPQVVEAVAAAAEKARNSTTEITQEMYMEALKTGINSAEARRRENNPNGAK